MTVLATPTSGLPESTATTGRPGRIQRVLPAVTVALCAGLLFLVEPLTAKLLLPIYGGTAAVWTGSVLFFQVLLLLGYGCVHGFLRVPADRGRSAVRVRLAGTAVLLALPLLVLPLDVPSWAAPGGHPPLLWLLGVLSVMVGLPFLALSTAGPLVSSWSGLDRARSPYRLYAASNAGSIGGLLAYPLLVEPLVGADALRRIWSVGYAVAAVLLLVCAVVAVRGTAVRTAEPANEPAHEPADESVEVPNRRREWLLWIALAALPVSLMLGTTTVLTTDVAPVPLLWVVPLALYLATFTIAFAPVREGVRRRVRATPPVLVGLLAVTAVGSTTALQLPKLVAILVDLAALFAVCLVAHQRLADRRPPVRRLTEFYLVVALGGALGGAFNGLVAPVVFVRISEFPLALLAAIGLLVMLGHATRSVAAGTSPLRQASTELGAMALPLVFLLLARITGAGAWVNLAIAVAALVACWFVAKWRPLPVALGVAGILLLTTFPLPPPLQAGRDFYGTYAVDESSGRHVLTEGTTVHGWQYLDAPRRTTPTAYYGRRGPIGDVLSTYAADPALRSVGVVGLGAGTLAAYGQPGQSMRFYELDPQVVGVARDPKLFSYLADSRATTSVVVGDGRLQVAREPDGAFGLLVLDAFSSDAIPTHLLTGEAFAEWTRVLRPDGLIAVHITNRYLDLAPVLAGAAQQSGLTAVIRDDPATGDPDRKPSRWVVLTRNPARLDALRRLPGWEPLPDKHVVRWTDDSSSLLSILGGGS